MVIDNNGLIVTLDSVCIYAVDNDDNNNNNMAVADDDDADDFDDVIIICKYCIIIMAHRACEWNKF